MILTVVEREAHRERVKKLIPQMKTSDIVKNFAKEGTQYCLQCNRPTGHQSADQGQEVEWATDQLDCC